MKKATDLLELELHGNSKEIYAFLGVERDSKKAGICAVIVNGQTFPCIGMTLDDMAKYRTELHAIVHKLKKTDVHLIKFEAVELLEIHRNPNEP